MKTLKLLSQILDNFPQLQGQFRDSQLPAMNLQDVIASRQTDSTTIDPNNDDVRCIPKVMQVRPKNLNEKEK